MGLEYATTMTNLAPADLDLMSGDTAVPQPAVPDGQGWKLYTTAASANKLYYTWVRGAGIATVSTTYAASATDEAVLADASAGPLTIHLPAPQGGLRIAVKKIDASSNAVTIDCPTYLIDGQATQVIPVQNAAYTLVANGTDWYII